MTPFCVHEHKMCDYFSPDVPEPDKKTKPANTHFEFSNFNFEHLIVWQQDYVLSEKTCSDIPLRLIGTDKGFEGRAIVDQMFRTSSLPLFGTSRAGKLMPQFILFRLLCDLTTSVGVTAFVVVLLFEVAVVAKG